MAKGNFRGGQMGGGGMNMNMIKQAQKMQQDMMRMQQELQEKEYEAAAGASGKALDWQQARPAVRAAWDRADLAQANRENIPADGMRQFALVSQAIG